MYYILENVIYFYGTAAVVTALISLGISKVPKLKPRNWSKNLPLVFGKTISIHVGIAGALVVVRALLLDNVSDLIASSYLILIQGMSIAGLAMLLENLPKVLFSKEYSANVRILNNEKFRHINELLTGNYAGYSKSSWLQKLGIVSVIDIDLANVLSAVNSDSKQSRFKEILREYINVDYLSGKVQELYKVYLEFENDNVCN
ncbi:MAG: hypothetical protein FWB72_01455 [Firmicutes bacterium]|nr:hypothetical protein [Bacillota bacterium]